MPLDKIFSRSVDIVSELISHSVKNKGTIAIVAFSFLFYYVKEYKLKPPKHLRHLPMRFSLIKTVRSLIAGDSFIVQKEEQVMPYVNSSSNPEDVYLTLTGVGWTVRTTMPETCRFIMTKCEKMNQSSQGYEHLLILRFIGGKNLLQISGKRWKHQRMVANPAFHRNMPVNLFGRLTQQVFTLIDETGGENIDFSDLMKRFTLEVIGKAAFDFEFDALKDKQSEWINIYTAINEGFVDPTFYIFPFFETKFGLNFFPKRKELHRKLDRFLLMLDDIVVKKREKLAQGDIGNEVLADNERDILTLMIESEEQSEEGGLTNTELKDNLCAFFFAGHDTTASTMCSIMYYLAKDNEIQDKARQEAVALLGNEPHDVLPSIAETKNLPYIDQVIKEALRTSGPVLEMGPREVAEDYNTGTTVIPKGSLVQVDNYAVHHNQRVWENPYKFDPERFSKDKTVTPASWIPFGGGPHMCIGNNFSLNEQRVFLSMLLRKYTWTLTEDSIHKDGLIFEGAAALSPKTLRLNLQRIY